MNYLLVHSELSCAALRRLCLLSQSSCPRLTPPATACLFPPGRFPENGSNQRHSYRVFKPSARLPLQSPPHPPLSHTHSHYLLFSRAHSEPCFKRCLLLHLCQVISHFFFLLYCFLFLSRGSDSLGGTRASSLGWRVRGWGSGWVETETSSLNRCLS